MELIPFSSIHELPKQCKLLIYGAGGRGATLFRIVERYRDDIEVFGFMDTYKSGEFLDHTIYPLSTLNDLLASDSSLEIVIGSTYVNEIYCALSSFHIARVYTPNPYMVNEKKTLQTTSQTAKSLASGLSSISSMFKRKQDREFIKLIPDVFTYSPTSAVQFIGIMNHYVTLNEQYFDFINKEKIKTAIDAGMENGHTALRFLLHFPGVNVHCFEPFPASLQLSQYYVYLNKHKNINITFKGLSDKSTTLNLSIDPKAFSANKISESCTKGYSTTIETTTLDEYVKSTQITKVDFIKLDIEGHEIQAINGALATIKRDRPQIAISVYHRISDYYEIPKLMRSICEKYNFYIGMYDLSRFQETVLYCIPEEIDTNG